MKLADVLLTFFDAVRLIQEMAVQAHQGRLVDLVEVEKLLEKVEKEKVPVAGKKAKKSKKEERHLVERSEEAGSAVEPRPVSFTMELVHLESIPEWMAELLPNSWN